MWKRKYTRTSTMKSMSMIYMRLIIRVSKKIKNDISMSLKANSNIYIILKPRTVWLLSMKKKVNNISECNLLHDILNTYKLSKNLISHYYLILHRCTNTWKGGAKFNNFWILLDSGCTSMIFIWRLIINNLLLKKTMWCNGTHKGVVLIPI